MDTPDSEDTEDTAVDTPDSEVTPDTPVDTLDSATDTAVALTEATDTTDKKSPCYNLQRLSRPA